MSLSDGSLTAYKDDRGLPQSDSDTAYHSSTSVSHTTYDLNVSSKKRDRSTSFVSSSGISSTEATGSYTLEQNSNDVTKPPKKKIRLLTSANPSSQTTEYEATQATGSGSSGAESTALSSSADESQSSTQPHTETRVSSRVDLSRIRMMKIYIKGELYSIYDRQRGRYIYRADQNQNLNVTYGPDGQCTEIQDRQSGEFVYQKPGSPTD
ncbi:hypothetical protein GGS21DRAFT_544071 [Xylaria nigripes]|nr:hypothetical protein GGS21DRAFT_544071 [Xylaria nigripes]